MVKAVRVPKAGDIKNWPDDPKMKVFVSNGTLYGGYRLRKRDPQTHRQHEQKVYSGRIVDNVYYPMEEFREKFTRTGELRDKVAAQAQVKAAGLPAEVAERVMRCDAERQALMTSIAGVLEEFGSDLSDAEPEKLVTKKPAKKSPKKLASEALDSFVAGDKDGLEDIEGVSVAQVKAAGVGATLVTLPAQECRAALMQCGTASPVWGGEGVKTTGLIHGSVFITREADVAAAVSRLWDKQDSGLVLSVPGDDKPRIEPKDLLAGTKKFVPGQSGVGLGLVMGQQAASREVDGVTVAVLVTGTADGSLEAATGRVAVLAVTDAKLTASAMQSFLWSVTAGFAESGFLSEGVTAVAVATGSVLPDAGKTAKLCAAAAEAARAAALKAKRHSA